MSKRAVAPTYLQPIECMASPCVRHAAMLIEQALYEARGGYGLIVPESLFPSQSDRTHWRVKYAAELRANERLASMLNDHGVDHICEAAGLTNNERDAVLLRAGGLSWGEVAQRFIDTGSSAGIGAVKSYARRARVKLASALTTSPMEDSQL